MFEDDADSSAISRGAVVSRMRFKSRKILALRVKKRLRASKPALCFLPRRYVTWTKLGEATAGKVTGCVVVLRVVNTARSTGGTLERAVFTTPRTTSQPVTFPAVASFTI